jgi:hypothetical protein
MQQCPTHHILYFVILIIMANNTDCGTSHSTVSLIVCVLVCPDVLLRVTSQTPYRQTDSFPAYYNSTNKTHYLLLVRRYCIYSI